MKDSLRDALFKATPTGGAGDTEAEPVVHLGPCFSTVRPDRVVQSLTIRFATQPWVSFDYHLRSLGCSCSPTQINLEFRDPDTRMRVVIEGRNLAQVYTHLMANRVEWIQPIPLERDFAADGEPVVTQVAVTNITPK